MIELDPVKHHDAKLALAAQLANWLATSEGQAAIAAYEIKGERLFHPESDPKPAGGS